MWVINKINASAINANKIQVTFNKPVANTKDAKFEVKKSGVVIAATAKFNDEATEVLLTKASGDYIAGDYTVTISDIEGLETVTEEVKFEEQKVAEIQIIGDAIKASGDNPATATVSYRALNQYGDDYTKKASLKVTGSNGTNPTLDANKGLVTLNNTNFNAVGAPKEAVVTLVDPSSGVSVSQTVKIADAAAVQSFELGELSYPKDKTRVYANVTEAAKIAFTAKDQYGNKIEDPSSAVRLVSSDETTAKFSFVKGSDDKFYIRVNTTGATVAKDVTLTAVNSRTGAVVTKTVRVDLEPKATSIALGNINQEMIAAKDTVYMDLEVKDQFGEVMAPKDYATSANEANLGISGTAPIAAGQMEIVTDKYDDNYGKLKLTPQAKGTATLVATLGGNTVTKSVEVKEERILTEIVAPAKNSTVVQGATAKLGFKFFDQYGKEIKAAADTPNMKYKITLTKVDGATGAVVLDSTVAENAAESNLNDIKVKAAAGLEGSYKVKVELLGNNDKVLSSAETTVKSVADNAEGLTYEVKAIDPLTFETGYTLNQGKNPYAKVIDIVGTDKDGNTITINPVQIKDVKVVGALTGGAEYLEVAKVTTESPEGKIDAQEGNWVVAAKKLADKNMPAGLKIRVTLNTADGLKILDAPVKILEEAPKAQEVMIINKAVSVNDPTKLATGYRVVDQLTFDTLAQAKDAAQQTSGSLKSNEVFVTTKDQFGVYKNVSADFIVNTPNLINIDSNGKFTTTAAGAFTLTQDATYTAGSKIKLSVLEGDKTATLDVVIKEIADVSGGAASTQDSIAAAQTSTITFTRGLSKDSRKAIETAIGAAVGGVAKTDLSYSWNANNTVITITNNHASTAATFSADGTVDNAKVIDVFGNVNASDLTLDLKS